MNKMKKITAPFLLCCLLLSDGYAQKNTNNGAAKHSGPYLQKTPSVQSILPGAYQTAQYFPMLRGKRVAVFANHTATIGETHLVDSMQKAGIKVTKIFGPEHGFRGTADAGEKVDTYTDSKTGITVISLYGKKRKPSKQDLADVDVMLFDIQDVGVRFYTFISSLQEFMETAIEFNKPLVILDRPNPNGFYVDGPVLDTAFKSFVGMQPIPVVYGMTIGEYAHYLLGENLLETKIKKVIPHLRNKLTATGAAGIGNNITVIKCLNYTHQSKYVLPVKPSPNLPDAGSIYWYPSTCFFEGTVLSEGRGTDKPFEIFGHPTLPDHLYQFKPVSRDGAKNPKLENKTCYGWNVSASNKEILSELNGHLQINYLLKAYELFPDKENFFIVPKRENVKPTEIFFNKLAGNAELMQQVKAGKTEQQIRESWEPKLSDFKKTRLKYLLYAE